jgi:hypothetical protein
MLLRAEFSVLQQSITAKMVGRVPKTRVRNSENGEGGNPITGVSKSEYRWVEVSTESVGG